MSDVDDELHDDACVVCYERTVAHARVFAPCGHWCCAGCDARLTARRMWACPVCRAPRAGAPPRAQWPDPSADADFVVLHALGPPRLVDDLARALADPPDDAASWTREWETLAPPADALPPRAADVDAARVSPLVVDLARALLLPPAPARRAGAAEDADAADAADASSDADAPPAPRVTTAEVAVQTALHSDAVRRALASLFRMGEPTATRHASGIAARAGRVVGRRAATRPLLRPALPDG